LADWTEEPRDTYLKNYSLTVFKSDSMAAGRWG